MHLPLKRFSTAAALGLTLALPLGGLGCASTAWEQEHQRLTALDASMRAAASSLNQADLSAAKLQLDEADALVKTDFEARRVQSLRQVMAGAVALREGNGDGAADAWSRIPSPTLRYEIQEKAAGVGVQVPDTPGGV